MEDFESKPAGLKKAVAGLTIVEVMLKKLAEGRFHVQRGGRRWIS